MVSPSQSPRDFNRELENIRAELQELRTQVEDTGRGNWFRFLISFGFTVMAVGVGIAFSSPQGIDPAFKSILASVILIFGLTVLIRATFWYRPQQLPRRLVQSSIIVLSVGGILLMIGGILRTQFGTDVPSLILSGCVVSAIGSVLASISLSKLHIRI
jgi:hypothetical protein